jgi:hypothetical protein
VAQIAAESCRARQNMFELARSTVAAEPEIVQIAAVCRSDLHLAEHAALAFRYPPKGQRVDLVAALCCSARSSAGPNVDLLFQTFD